MNTREQKIRNKGLDYTKLDPNIRDLVRVLNSFPGVSTVESCGGHEHPNEAQWPKDHYYVKFDIEWGVHGHFSLAILAWAINEANGREGRILLPVSPPPFPTFPGKELLFMIEGNKGDSQELTDFLNSVVDVFISADVLDMLNSLPPYGLY